MNKRNETSGLHETQPETGQTDTPRFHLPTLLQVLKTLTTHVLGCTEDEALTFSSSRLSESGLQENMWLGRRWLGPPRKHATHPTTCVAMSAPGVVACIPQEALERHCVTKAEML